MRLPLATPASWLALLCILASAGLWVWSRRIPPSVWETTSALAVNAPAVSPAASPLASGDSSSPAAGEETPPKPPVEPAPATSLPSPSASPATDIPATAALASTPSPSQTPKPTPPPSEAELAGPLPQHSAADPAPQPAATAAPAASPANSSTASAPLLPAPFDFASFAQQPQQWPRQVLLLAPVRFPAIMRGVNIGTLQIPAGSPVLLRKVNPDGSIEIELPASPGSIAKVKAQTTDLLARARAAAAAAPTPARP